MAFSTQERDLLMAAAGVGPTVIGWLEEIGFSTLQQLAHASIAEVTGQVAVMTGSACLGESPQAHAAIASAIAAARAHGVSRTSSRKSSIIR